MKHRSLKARPNEFYSKYNSFVVCVFFLKSKTNKHILSWFLSNSFYKINVFTCLTECKFPSSTPPRLQKIRKHLYLISLYEQHNYIMICVTSHSAFQAFNKYNMQFYGSSTNVVIENFMSQCCINFTLQLMQLKQISDPSVFKATNNAVEIRLNNSDHFLYMQHISDHYLSIYLISSNHLLKHNLSFICPC